ncbi:MAG: TonB-dependent receptor [Rhizomicrobium sp.]
MIWGTQAIVGNFRARWLATAAVAAMLMGGQALAQEMRSMSIPAEDAGAAIQDFTKQSGLQVFAPAEDLRGIRTNAVQGSLSPLEAAHRLVAGTGLEIVQTGDNAITIRRPTTQISAPSADEAANGGAVEEVVVTGSRIKRAGFDTLEAAIVTSSEQIQQRGYTNILDALQATPGFGVPGSSSLGAGQGRLGIGQSFANFFGLGSQRTLTLVNGRRFVSSNTAAGGSGSNASPGSQVDLNLIPVGLVDHVETVAIGGAPVYGADAIAGTVNIILKDHYEGAELTAQYGISDQGDAENQTYRALFGANFDNDRGNVVFSAEYNKQDSLRMSDRFGLLYALPNPADTGPNDGIPAFFFNPNTSFAFMTEGGLPYDGSVLDIPGLHYPGLYPNGNYIFNASGQPLQFDKKGQLVPMNFGTPAQNAQLGGGAYIPLYASGGDGVTAADHFGLLAGTTRTLLNGNAHYDLAPNVRAFLETSYAHTDGVLPSDLTSIIAPNIIGAESLSFSVTNPYLSSGDRATILANGLTTFNLSRNLNDVVDTMPAHSQEDVYRIVGGFEGSFQAWSNEWSWNASYNYGNSRTDSTDNYIDPTRILLAADAVKDASGNIVCASGGSCVPIDLFGENAFSKQAANYVTNHAEGIGINTLEDINANLSGDLPISVFGADPVKFNIGYEHRRESANFKPNAALAAGDSIDGVPGYSPIAGSFHTDEAYGETVIPLISDDEGLPVIKSASFEGAARYVQNSAAGGDVTWSAGGRVAPRLPGWGDGLVLRGVATHAIRDPAITELYLGSSGVLNGLTDPCDAGNVGAGPDPSARLANCTKALAAVGGPAPGSFHSTTGSISQAGVESGNPDLKNEVANSWSLGFVYQPVSDSHFRFSADWSNIDLRNGIQLLDIDSILSACYDSPSFPSTACSHFSRLTKAQATGPRIAGDIAAGYTEGYVNTSSLNFAGLILSAQYDSDLADMFSSMNDAGALSLSGTMFYTDRYDEVSFAGQPTAFEAGTLDVPKYKLQLNAGYTWHKFDTSVQVLWTSSSVIDNTLTTETYANFTVPNYTLINATIGYQLTDMFHAQIVVNNVFNKKLPEVAQLERSFNLYDPIGRTFLFRVTGDL